MGRHIAVTTRAAVSVLALSVGVAAAGVVHAQEVTEPAVAQQDAEPQFGTIVVTAQRREQALQETPLSVSAITADALADKGVSTLSDISVGSVPGMQIVPFAGSPSVLAVNARGIGLSDSTQGTQEMAVPIYIDGVPLGRGQGLGIELINPERVEFLRGPQGQLFGRNAQGGAIQFVSRRPSGEFAVDGTVGFTNYDGTRQRLSVDAPEIAGIRLQASVVKAQHDAYTKNPDGPGITEHADYGYLDTFGYRIAAEFSPTSTLRFNYTYDNSKITDSQPYGVWVPVDIIGRPPYSPMPAGADEYPDEVNSPTYNQYFKTISRGHGLTVNFLASDALTFKSITSYREAGRDGSSTLSDALVAGGSASGILRSNANELVDQEQFYQELQAFADWGRLNLTVGATYFWENVIDERRSFLTGPGFNAPALGLNPIFANCIGLEKCFTAHSEQGAKTDSYGVYGQATYVPAILNDNLELTAGLRWSDDTKVAERTYIAPPALPPLTEETPSGALPPEAKFHASRFDPAFTIKYNFTDDINMYARYATAYRAGGANVRSSTFTSYDEEEVEAWEVGLKSVLFNTMTLNLAWYHNTLKGYQASIQESPTTNPSLTNTVNLEEPVKIWGIELESSIRVMDGLTFTGAYAYMHSDKWNDMDNPLTAEEDITRFYSIQSPEHAGNVAVDYETPELGFGTIAVHADYSFSSKYWTTPGGLLVASLGPTYERPATKTSMLNGRVALKMGGNNGAGFEVAAFGKNILDDTYYVYGFDGAGSGGGFMQILQAPRTYGLELRVTY